VSARQQDAGRLFAQNVPGCGSGQQKGRIGGAAIELIDLQGAGEVTNMGRQPGLETRGIEAVVLADIADKGLGRRWRGSVVHGGS
jgi:hypothetical protein